MKLQNFLGLFPMVIFTLFYIGCRPLKPMDITALNPNTGQWKLDYNYFPVNPNWQYKLTTGKLPQTVVQCPMSNSPIAWKNSPTCTSQDLHFNFGQPFFCTTKFTGYGGHMNWFPVTEVGLINFKDHSLDDDYNFYLQTPDSSLYMSGGANPDMDPMNQFLALEFDSDEFPDPVDDDYNIWWNRFHTAVDHGDSFWGQIKEGNYAEAQAMVKDKLAIVTGMAGIDIGHDDSNTWTAELHPVFGMFILTDEESSINPDGSIAMTDTWSFFIRNNGDEGGCGVYLESTGSTILKVFIPEIPYYYAQTQKSYQADPSDKVTIDDGNVHITNWNGETDPNNHLYWQHWTKQITNGGVIFTFYVGCCTNYSAGIFVGDIKMNWTIHFIGFKDYRKIDKFVDESKFKDQFKWMYANAEKKDFEMEYETKADSLLYSRVSKLNNREKQELHQALLGKITLPGMPKIEPIPKGKSIKIEAIPAEKDSINIQQFNAQVKKMTKRDMAKRYSKYASPVANPNSGNDYVQRKLLKDELIEAYLKSKNL
jgi:hypothetical protein